MGALAVCLGLVVYFNQSLFFSWADVIEVEEIEVPVFCIERKARFERRFRDAVRSSAPKYGLIYCGYILTDHGFLALPESRVAWRRWPDAPREALLRTLNPGCRYGVVLRGYRRPKGGEKPQTHNNPTLVRVIEPLGCRAPGAEP